MIIWLYQQKGEIKMTREEALNILYNASVYHPDYLDALNMAIKQEPFINKSCVSSGVCEYDKNKVLDKIKAEIIELTKCSYGTECLGANCPSNTDCMICGDHVLEIIDKYKADIRRKK